jgi:hypothetical protein
VVGQAQLCSVSHAQRFVGAAGERRVAAGVERVLAVCAFAHREVKVARIPSPVLLL